MPYLGVAPNPRENREVDDISSGFNGGTTQFTLQSGGSNVSPGSDTAIIVSLGGVVQNPGTDYTIAASTITFTTAPASGLSFFGVVLAQSVDIETPADGTVTTSKIVDGAVTNAKVNASAAIAVSKLANFVTNNADNRVITGSGTTNTLNGEADLTFDGNDLTINKTSGDSDVIIKTTTSGNPVLKFNASGAGGHEIAFDRSATALTFTTTGSSERMRIDSSGNVGIGVTSPSSKLHINCGSDNTAVQINSTDAGSFYQAIDNTGESVFGHSGANAIISVDPGASVSSSAIVFQVDANSEKMRIDSSGRVGIGTTNPNYELQVNDSSGTISVLQLTNTTTGTGAGDGLLMYITGNDTIISNEEAGYMRFQTSGLERMRIDSSGNVSIGSTSNVAPLNVRGMTDGNLHVRPITSIHSGTGVGLDVLNDANNAVKDLAIRAATTVFRNASSESMRIASNGKILINRTNEDGSGVINLALNSSGHGISTRTGSNSTQTHLDFGNQNGIVGSIQTNGSSTAFNTSSDYRLKENAVAISDGITRLKTLKPYRFNFKADASTTVDGFFAHEVTAVPEAISGTKDEVDSDNNPVYQRIDQSKLVPLLVAAVQELITKVETLEAA